MNSNIEKICGISEITPDFDSIASNPNFVFQLMIVIQQLCYTTLKVQS